MKDIVTEKNTTQTDKNNNFKYLHIHSDLFTNHNNFIQKYFLYVIPSMYRIYTF